MQTPTSSKSKFSVVSTPASVAAKPQPRRSQRVVQQPERPSSSSSSKPTTPAHGASTSQRPHYVPNAATLPYSGNPVPTAPQAMTSTYASRLRTGATLLMQPVISAASSNSLNALGPVKRRGGVVNYAEGASDDEFGADSDDDEDFVNSARGGRRGTPRASNTPVARSSTPTTPHTQVATPRAELDKTYLGHLPPAKFISSKTASRTRHEYPSLDAIEKAAKVKDVMIPIRIDLDTDTHRIRDSFTWNLNEENVTPEIFARIFCQDVDLPPVPYVDQIAGTIKAQLEEHAGVASFDVGQSSDESDIEETQLRAHSSKVDQAVKMDIDSEEKHPPRRSRTEELDAEREQSDCRVILSLDVQINTYHLLDHIEWDLSPASTSPSAAQVTPELFAQTLCADIGLSGEAAPLIAHAIHEEILKHKKDAIEWGVLAGDTTVQRGAPRAKGPKPLRGVWRDWNETAEFGPRLEVMSTEEMERREIERERVARRLRRDTSRFVKATVRRRR